MYFPSLSPVSARENLVSYIWHHSLSMRHFPQTFLVPRVSHPWAEGIGKPIKMKEGCILSVTYYLVHFSVLNQPTGPCEIQPSRTSFVLQSCFMLMLSPSLSIILVICLDCLVLLSVSLSLSLSPPQGWKQQGCKVPVFPQLLSITPVTAGLSITSKSDPLWAHQACWYTHTKWGLEQEWRDEGGPVSACWVSLERHRYTHTPHTHCKALLVKGTSLILVIFIQPPSTLPPTVLKCQHEPWAAENHVAEHIHVQGCMYSG